MYVKTFIVSQGNNTSKGYKGYGYQTEIEFCLSAHCKK